MGLAMKLSDIAKAAERKFGPISVPIEDDNGKPLVEFAKLIHLSDPQKAAIKKIEVAEHKKAADAGFVPSMFDDTARAREILAAVADKKPEARKILAGMDDAAVLLLISVVRGDDLDENEDEQGKE